MDEKITSKVGHVEKMFGEQFNIVTTNAEGNRLLSGSANNLIPTSLIIASPTDQSSGGTVDIGLPSLICTDYEGNPLRLTYSILTGNGLVNPANSDVIQFQVDETTLRCMENSDNLSVYAPGLVADNSVIEVENNKLDLNISKLVDLNRIKVTEASKVFGIDNILDEREYLTVNAYAFVDHNTLIINESEEQSVKTGFQNQYISVNMKNLNDNQTIKIDKNKHYYVDTNQLTRATSTKFGVLKYDNSTIQINEGTGQIYVNTGALRKVGVGGGTGLVYVPKAGTAGEYFNADAQGKLVIKPQYMPKAAIYSTTKDSQGFGVCAVDGVTLTADGNGKLSVITAGLKVPTKNANGVVRPDQVTIKLNRDGMVSVQTQNLEQASPSRYGIVKYDNNTIGKNAAGQLEVKMASTWNNSINKLNNDIAALSNQLIAIRKQLNDFEGRMSAVQGAKFEILSSNNQSIETMQISIGVSRLAVTGSTTSSINKYKSDEFTIRYATGYPFTISITNMNSSWCSIEGIEINGETKLPGSQISIQNGAGEDTFCFIISYDASTIRASKSTLYGYSSITFKDYTSGAILKTISVTVEGTSTTLISPTDIGALQRPQLKINQKPQLVTQLKQQMLDSPPLSELLKQQARLGATTVTGNNVLNSKLTVSSLKTLKNVTPVKLNN